MLLKSYLYAHYYPDFTDDAMLDAVAVLLGDYDGMRKKAAYVLLKMILVRPAFITLMNQIAKKAPVTDREDPRVRKWKNNVVKIGHCEECGSEENLEAHHIAYWSEAPLDRINPKNGRCLCAICHAKEHEGESIHPMMMAKVGVLYG